MLRSDVIDPDSQEFPLLGYTVIAAVGGVAASHDELRRLLAAVGFEQYLPGLPEARTALRRAMRAWLQELSSSRDDQLVLGGDEDEPDQGRSRQLIREITGAQLITMALVAENVDLAHLGLSYLTNLRVFFDRSSSQLYLTTTPTGQPDPLQLAVQTTPRDQALLAGLRPFWDHYRGLHTTADIGRMIQAIIADLDATSLRPGGGVSFVPYAQRPALERLKDLIEHTLPPAAGKSNESALLHLPVIDRPAVRAHMARVIHHSLLGEVTAMQKNLDRLVQQSQAATEQGRPGTIRTSTVANRLAEYRAMRAKIELYGEILGARQQQALRALGELQMAARSLLDSAAGALADNDSAQVAATEPQAGYEPVTRTDQRPEMAEHQAA